MLLKRHRLPSTLSFLTVEGLSLELYFNGNSLAQNWLWPKGVILLLNIWQCEPFSKKNGHEYYTARLSFPLLSLKNRDLLHIFVINPIYGDLTLLPLDILHFILHKQISHFSAVMTYTLIPPTHTVPLTWNDPVFSSPLSKASSGCGEPPVSLTSSISPSNFCAHTEPSTHCHFCTWTSVLESVACGSVFPSVKSQTDKSLCS